MVSLSVAIMTHPERLEMAKELQSHIGAGKITGIEETTLWGAARKSWLNYGGVDYHMVIQDDVWANPTLIEDVRHVLSFIPDRTIVNLADLTPRRKYRWRASQLMGNARAIIMPVSMIAHFIEWCDEHIVPAITADDFRFSVYCHEHSVPIYYTNPTLVYQREVPSIYKRASYIRRKSRHIGDNSIRDYDWSDIVTNPVKTHDKNKPLMFDYARGEMTFCYPEGAIYPNPNIVSLHNILPFQGMFAAEGWLGTGEARALLIPPLYHYVESVKLPSPLDGKFAFEMDARIGHNLGGQNKKLKADFEAAGFTPKRGGGFVNLIIRLGHRELFNRSRSLYFNHTRTQKTFTAMCSNVDHIEIDIESKFWGNAGVMLDLKYSEV